MTVDLQLIPLPRLSVREMGMEDPSFCRTITSIRYVDIVQKTNIADVFYIGRE